MAIQRSNIIISSKQRKPYMDVYKGLLMLFVIFGHISYAIGVNVNNHSNIVYNCLQGFASNWIAPFYMAAFFVASGFCSSFSKPLKQQVVSDVKTLIVPAWVVTIVVSLFRYETTETLLLLAKKLLLQGGGFWFVVSLFCARIIYYFTLKIDKRILRFILLFILSFIGIYLNGHFQDRVWYLFHALSLCVFLEVGNYLRNDKVLNIWSMLISGIIYVVIILFLQYYEKRVPSLCAIQTFNFRWMPIYFILASTGSIVCLSLCKLLQKCSPLEYVGRNSIIYYLTHYQFFNISIPLIATFILSKNSSIIWSISIFLALFIGSVIWSTLISMLLNTKYLCWIIGRNNVK